LWCFFFGFFFLTAWGCVDHRCFFDGLTVTGVGALVVLDVVVEDEVEVELEEDVDELLEVVVLDVVLLDVGVLEVVLLDVGVLVVELDELLLLEEVDDGAQDSLSEATTPVIGRFMSEIGVPGGKLTLNVRTWPPTRVTVTVQASAEAIGIAATSIATSVAPTSASALSSLRLLSNFRSSPPRNHGVSVRSSLRSVPSATLNASYCLVRSFATLNCPPRRRLRFDVRRDAENAAHAAGKRIRRRRATQLPKKYTRRLKLRLK
jgi:hypothetical protein